MKDERTEVKNTLNADLPRLPVLDVLDGRAGV